MVAVVEEELLFHRLGSSSSGSSDSGSSSSATAGIDLDGGSYAATSDADTFIIDMALMVLVLYH